MFLWLLGLTDMVQRLQKLRTYLRACFHDVVENSFNRRCTIWISPTLYGLLSLVISRIHFLQRSWTPDATLLEGGGEGGACLACLDDEMELIMFWFASTLKIMKEKNIRAEVTKRLPQPNIAEINFPLPWINVFIMLQSKVWKFVLNASTNCLIEIDK